MEYKNDWESSKLRFEALWSRELIDRCCISVTAPRKGKEDIYKKLKSVPRLHNWGDAEAIVKRHKSLFEVTFFGGESFPGIWLNMGPSGHAGFFKNVSYKVVNGETVWFTPLLDQELSHQLVFEKKSALYAMTLEHARYYVAESKGSFFVSMPDTSGNLDALAHLRGSDKLLVDLLLNPAEVKDTLKIIQSAWEKTILEIYQIVKTNNDGGSMIYWLKTWAPGLHSQLQADISVMISPELYKEFIVPELASQSAFLDYSLYHLDGNEQIRHLDLLLALEHIQIIQWTSVAGQPSPIHFLDVFKKIQKSGKALLIRLDDVQLVEPLLQQLSSKGLYLVVEAESQEIAQDIIKKTYTCTHE